MAAAITTNSTTLEGQILEVVTAANALELTLAEDANQGLYNIAYDTEAGQATLTVTVDVAFTPDASGQIVVSAQEYLV